METMEAWEKEMDAYMATLAAFCASDDFVPAIVASTDASFGSTHYKVELLPDGTWRVLWSGQIGNRYDSPGHLLGIPAAAGDGPFEDDDAIAEQARMEAAEIASAMRDDLRDRYAFAKTYRPAAVGQESRT